MTYPTADDTAARKQLADAFRRKASELIAVAPQVSDDLQPCAKKAAQIFEDMAGEIEEGTDKGRAEFADFVRHATQKGIAFDKALSSVMSQPTPPGL